MSLLRSKATRLFIQDAAGLRDATEAARTWSAPNLAAALRANVDHLYIAREHSFNNMYLAVAVANAAPCNMVASYWNGRDWVGVTSFLDETSGLAQSGFIQFPEEGQNATWTKAKASSIAGLEASGVETELFVLRLTFSANLSLNTEIRAVKTLLSDDRLMEVLFPEIRQYLPVGQNDFLPQHEAAKDAIVNYLIVKGVIQFEEQIRSPDEWMIAATYKTLELILAPIAGNEQLKEVKNEMARKAKEHLPMSAASLDKDKSEKLEVSERSPGSVRWLER